MRKLYSLIILLVSFSSQAQIILSDLEKFEFSEVPSLSVKAYLELATNHSQENNFDSSYYYLTAARKAAETSGDNHQIADVIFMEGRFFDQLSLYNESQKYYLEAIPIYLQLSDTNRLASSYNKLGVSYKHTGEYSKAIHALNSSFEFYVTLDDSLGEASVQINLGNVFKNIGKNDKAIDSYRKAISIYKKYNNESAIANCYNNLGNVYKNTDVFDSAFYYMYLTRDIRLKTKDDSGLSFVYHNLANLHLKTGDLDSSLYYIEESYKLKVAAGNIFAQAQDMQVYADIFMRKGFWDKAARYLETALFLTKNYANIEFESDLTEDLGYCYREMGDYKKSSDYYARHIVLKDSIEKLVSMEQLERGLIEYELISDSLQRNQLILQKDLQVAKNENDELSNKILRRNIILLIVSSAFVLAFLIFFLLRYRRRLKTTSEKHLKLARTSVPKEEKEILLKEVHHRVKNNFQIINSLIRIQSEFMNESNFQEKLKDLENRIQSMSLIHEKLYKTEKISKLNVREYLTELAENIQDSYEVSTDLTFDLNVQQVEYGIDSLIPLGLIMNETISNAIKHAFKGIANPKITVFLENESDKTKLIIQDNGVGSVKTLEQLKDESLGMELILDLTEQLDGKVKLTTTSGFIYKFEFPRLK